MIGFACEGLCLVIRKVFFEPGYKFFVTVMLLKQRGNKVCWKKVFWRTHLLKVYLKCFTNPDGF